VRCLAPVAWFNSVRQGEGKRGGQEWQVEAGRCSTDYYRWHAMEARAVSDSCAQ